MIEWIQCNTHTLTCDCAQSQSHFSFALGAIGRRTQGGIPLHTCAHALAHNCTFARTFAPHIDTPFQAEELWMNMFAVAVAVARHPNRIL